jgi:hypothetical protein
VKFIKTHVGHEDELRTKRLSQKEQTLIVEQLQAGISNDRILEDARKTIWESDRDFETVEKKFRERNK